LNALYPLATVPYITSWYTTDFGRTFTGCGRNVVVIQAVDLRPQTRIMSVADATSGLTPLPSVYSAMSVCMCTPSIYWRRNRRQDSREASSSSSTTTHSRRPIHGRRRGGGTRRAAAVVVIVVVGCHCGTQYVYDRIFKRLGTFL